jgi:HEAT repeat protein
MHTLTILAAATLLTAPGQAARPDYTFDEVIDSPMYRDPSLPGPPTVAVLPEGAVDLWLRALRRPEVEVRAHAAADIALAHRRGMKEVKVAVGPLIAALEKPDQPTAVRLAVVEALVTLDARESAPALLRVARAGHRQVRQLAEPALARWRHAPAGAMWLERLDGSPASQPDLILAVRGLAALREEKAADRLRELALGPRVPGPVRVEAARALGQLRQEGLEEDAGRLAGDPSPVGLFSRLAAIALLSRHQGAEAVRLLQKLAQDEEPVVGALAAGRLIAIDPKHALPVRDHLLTSLDPKVRSRGVEVLFRTPSAEHIRLLADRLDDPHPDVRKQARRALHELASGKEWRPPVLKEGMRVLASTRRDAGPTDHWRGLEQSAILLTQLDHKPAADRLVELLAFDRPEVFISAAWGLRNLAVRETLPGVTKYVRAKQAELLEAEKLPGRPPLSFRLIDHQLSQVNQFLGRMKYRPADGVLRGFVPRRDDKPIGPETRAAALWALSKIHEGKPVEALTAAAEKRLNDVERVPPEDPRVRMMAAVLLGRTEAKSALPSLRKYCPDMRSSADLAANACGWAIARLTGEKLAPPETFYRTERRWFLSPFK